MIDHREKGIEDNAEVEDFFASDLVIFNKLTINDWVKLMGTSKNPHTEL